MTNNKIGFWSVFGIVVSSQIGTGVFIAPISLAPYGIYSLFGWGIAGLGAIALSLVFSHLCAKFPSTGGAHVYAGKAFGSAASFFVGWTYWVISWVSTTAVITACAGYLTPIIGLQSKETYLVIEFLLLLIILLLNLRGVSSAGNAEFILTLLKIIPLIIIPIAALPYFDISNFVIEDRIKDLPLTSALGGVTVLTLWGFVGLECSTAAAGSVKNPEKTIPRAIVVGTSAVAIIYFLNSVGIMGIIDGSSLSGSKAPYVDATEKVFGSNIAIFISFIACLICAGTLNAWVLVSGQIVLGLAQDGLMPSFFAKKNRFDAPTYGLIISCAGIAPLLILTTSDSLAAQVTLIIDFSVTAFLFVYLACCLAFFKLILQSSKKISYFQWFFGTIATIFCITVIFETPLKTLIIASLFTISGIPVYFGWYYPRRNSNNISCL